MTPEEANMKLFDDQKQRYAKEVKDLANYMREKADDFERNALRGLDESNIGERSRVNATTFDYTDWAINEIHNMNMNIHVGKFFRMAKDIDSERKRIVKTRDR